MAFSLEAVFGVDASGVRATMKSLRRDLNDFVTDWAKIGAGAAVGAFVALSKSAIDLAGRITDVSENLGINAESLQALEAQHKRNGVSSEQLAKALEKTKAAVIAAADGDKQAADALSKLGLKASELVRLPLDRQYEAIARAATLATNQNEAFAAVTALLGDRVGPKLLTSLRELAGTGLDGVVKSAKEAGLVLSDNVRSSIDQAGDAIDDFKRRATVAVGNILVNFHSKEGIELLELQFMKAVSMFGAKILDAVVEAGQMTWAVFKGTFTGVVNLFQDGMVEALKFIAAGVNKILPEKWEINVAGLDSLKSTGEGVSDSIARAIAQTSPSTFTKDVGEAFDGAIATQQKIVDSLTAFDLQIQADKLKKAGEAAGAAISAGAADAEKRIGAALGNFFGELDKASTTMSNSGEKPKNDIKEAADAVEDAGYHAGEAITEGAWTLKDGVSYLKDSVADLVGSVTGLMNKAVNIPHTGTPYESQSTDSLRGVRIRLQEQIADLERTRINRMSPETPTGSSFDQIYLEDQLRAVEYELTLRSQVQNVAARSGEEVARSHYGDNVTDRALRDMQDANTRSAVGIEQINERLRRLLGGSG